MDLLSLKLAVIVLCWASGFCGVALAQYLGRGNCGQLLSCCNALAAGVLFSAGIVCMLPDADEKLPKGYANIIAGAATILLILIEEVAIAMTREDSSSELECSSCNSACEIGPGLCPLNGGYRLIESGALSPPASPSRRSWSSSALLRRPSFSSGLPSFPSKLGVLRTGRYAYGMKKAVLFLGGEKRAFTPVDSPSLVDSVPAYPLLSDASAAVLEDCHTQLLTQSAGSVSLTRAVCLFVALSFHSVLEGIGLGTTSSFAALGSIAAAILAHKGLAAFALGNALRQSRGLSHRGIMLLAVVFASATPVGIGVGILVKEFAEGEIVAMCTAGAAGTFLQVALMEIIPSVLQATPGESSVGRMSRVFSILVGFILMNLLVLALG